MHLSEINSMTTSLDSAVAAQVITKESAFCGLSPGDIVQLRAQGFDHLEVLARFHTGRAVVTVKDFAAWQYLGGPLKGTRGESLWSSDLRDVTAVAYRDSAEVA